MQACHISHLYISKEEETGSVLLFLESQLHGVLVKYRRMNFVAFFYSEHPVYLFPIIAEEQPHAGCTMGD